MTPGAKSWHTPQPAVYLDQWVWIRFARVVQGNPQEPGDEDVLRSVEAAARQGIMRHASSVEAADHLPDPPGNTNYLTSW